MLTLKRILDAYATTGLQPVRNANEQYGDLPDGSYGRTHACGIRVVEIAESARRGEAPHHCYMGSGLGISRQYANGFVLGFDGKPLPESASDEAAEGYYHGQVTARVVFDDITFLTAYEDLGLLTDEQFAFLREAYQHGL